MKFPFVLSIGIALLFVLATAKPASNCFLNFSTQDCAKQKIVCPTGSLFWSYPTGSCDLTLTPNNSISGTAMQFSLSHRYLLGNEYSIKVYDAASPDPNSMLLYARGNGNTAFSSSSVTAEVMVTNGVAHLSLNAPSNINLYA